MCAYLSVNIDRRLINFHRNTYQFSNGNQLSKRFSFQIALRLQSSLPLCFMVFAGCIATDVCVCVFFWHGHKTILNLSHVCPHCRRCRHLFTMIFLIFNLFSFNRFVVIFQSLCRWGTHVNDIFNFIFHSSLPLNLSLSLCNFASVSSFYFVLFFCLFNFHLSLSLLISFR